MKKLLSIILILLITLSIVSGCSDKEKQKKDIAELEDTLDDSKLKDLVETNNENIVKESSTIDKPSEVENDSNTIISLDKDFFINNRDKILGKLDDDSIVLLFSDFPSEHENYSPNRNLYYLTGIDEDSVILLMSKIEGKINSTLYIKENNPQMAKWVGNSITVDEAKSISGIDNVKYIHTVDSDIRKYVSKVENIYLDLGYLDINDIKARKNINTQLSRAQTFGIDIIEKYKDKKVYSIFNEISELRSVKTSKEINRIKRAIDMTNEGIKEILRNSKGDMFEYQLESYFDFIVNSLGSKEVAFASIVAGGKNGVVLHYTDNNSKVNDEELVLLDLGATYEYYASDISRTFPANGKFSDRQKEIYNIVLKANEETIKEVKPGITLRELNETAKLILAEECKKIGLIESEREIQKYYFHAVGHSLGLDVHDPGITGRPLEPGMVITIEPGLYIEEEGIGVRIEDDILVTEDGYINLSENIIKSVEDIENFMKR